MNGGAANLSLSEGGRSLKKWWSTDRRLKSANAHKVPRGDPSVSPTSPHYLSQTCATLVKRKTFKKREREQGRASSGRVQTTPKLEERPPSTQDSPVTVVVVDNFVDEGEAIFSPVRITEPLGSPGNNPAAPNGGVMTSPRPPRVRTLKAFSLLKTVPEHEAPLGTTHAHTDSTGSQGSVETVKSIAGSGDSNDFSKSSFMDSLNSSPEWTPVEQNLWPGRVESLESGMSITSPQKKGNKSEAVIGQFKEFLCQMRQERPDYVNDIALTLEDLWYTGNLGDLTDLENTWPVAVTPILKNN